MWNYTKQTNEIFAKFLNETKHLKKTKLNIKQQLSKKIGYLGRHQSIETLFFDFSFEKKSKKFKFSISKKFKKTLKKILKKVKKNSQIYILILKLLENKKINIKYDYLTATQINEKYSFIDMIQVKSYKYIFK